MHRSEQEYALADAWRWLLSIAIGAVMGLLAFLVDWGIQAMNDAKFERVRGLIAGRGGFWAPYAALAGISVG